MLMRERVARALVSLARKLAGPEYKLPSVLLAPKYDMHPLKTTTVVVEYRMPVFEYSLLGKHGQESVFIDHQRAMERALITRLREGGFIRRSVTTPAFGTKALRMEVLTAASPRDITLESWGSDALKE